jgi:uncharacterized membrane protein (Fun14 family)
MWLISPLFATITRRTSKMDFDSVGSITTTIGGGFFAGIVTGWALKKVIKLVAVVVGLFLGALIYLQSQTIVNINWNNLQSVSETTLLTIGNSIINTGEISNIMGNIGIPLTGSLSAGFVVGFMKG